MLRPFQFLLVVFTALSLLAGPAAAQSLDIENNATFEVEKELDVAGDLGTASGGSVSFASGASLTLNGSAQQSVGTAVTVMDLTLDNANGAVLNAAVDVTGTLTLTDGPLTTNGNLTLPSTDESSSARIAGSGSGTISGNVTAERFLERKDGGAHDSHWRFLASPVDAPLDTEPGGGGGKHDIFDGAPLLSNTWTQGDGITGANTQVSGADPSVFFYDETAAVGSDLTQGWAAVNDLANPTGQSEIEPQEGFAVYLFADRDFDGSPDEFPRVLSATGTISDENTGTDVSLPVTCNDNDGSGSDGCTDDFDGWNLVANPFLSHIDWQSSNVTQTNLDAPAYVYDSDNDQYQLTDGTNSNGGDPYIAPFQAVFVKANAQAGDESNVDLQVNSGAKADPSSADDREFKSTDSEPLVSLQLSDGSDAEETRITYREAAEGGKDRFDGYQLTPLSGNYYFLASEMAGREALFDSQYRPPPADQDTLDLAIDVTAGGTYTLATDTLENLPSDWNVILEDTESGARWDLGAGESVSFEVDAPGSKLTTEETSPTDLLADGPTVATAEGSSDLPSYRLYVGPQAALPVEFASFEAATEGTDRVALTWKTASETNNAGFAVERRVLSSDESSSDAEWAEVGFVDGAGTTTRAQSYRFEDTGLPFEADRVHYRLRQEDLDGTSSRSDEVAVELRAPSEVRLHTPFPNPARTRTTLRYEVPEPTSVEIALYNTLGQRVRTVTARWVESGRTEKTLDVSGLSSGTYFLRMQAGDRVQTRRVTVVR